MPPAGFEAAIPASERPQTHTLDRAATGIGTVDGDANVNNSRERKRIHPSTGLRATCFSRGWQLTSPFSLSRLHDHTQTHHKFGRTLLDGWSARRRDLYPTTDNTHKRLTSMSPAVFEPAVPAIELPQSHALDRAATGISTTFFSVHLICRVWRITGTEKDSRLLRWDAV
jgi:hypothetical protein